MQNRGVQIRNRSESDPIRSDFGTKIFFSDWIGLISDFDHQSDDINDIYMDWKNKFLFVADMHAPPITRRVRSEYTLWLTKDITKKLGTAQVC